MPITRMRPLSSDHFLEGEVGAKWRSGYVRLGTDNTYKCVHTRTHTCTHTNTETRLQCASFINAAIIIKYYTIFTMLPKLFVYMCHNHCTATSYLQSILKYVLLIVVLDRCSMCVFNEAPSSLSLSSCLPFVDEGSGDDLQFL